MNALYVSAGDGDGDDDNGSGVECMCVQPFVHDDTTRTVHTMAGACIRSLGSVVGGLGFLNTSDIRTVSRSSSSWLCSRSQENTCAARYSSAQRQQQDTT
jgi:hypothetical protein